MKLALSRRLQKIILPLALLFLLCGFGIYNLWASVSPMYVKILSGETFVLGWPALQTSGLVGFSQFLSDLYFKLGCLQLGVFAVTGLLGLRRPIVLRLYVVMAILQGLIMLPAIYLYVKVPAFLMTVPELTERYSGTNQYGLIVTHFWYLAPVILVLAIWAVLLGTRAVRNIYWRTYDTEADWGDRLLEDIRSNGREPSLRRGSYVSIALHFLVLVLIPLLMNLDGCVDPYELPKGSGQPQVMEVQKVKKKKKKKRIVLNMNSPIIFHRPEIDDSKVFEEVDELTRDTYKANTQGGKPGQGGGKEGGWPEGAENAKIRFVRLKVSGSIDWDQDMGEGADYNFLKKFGEYTGFAIADNTEFVSVAQLRKFPEGKAPPFIYFTGGSGSISLSARDAKILREYLVEEGGMIFADAGGRGFDRPFRAMMKQVLPEYEFITLSHDDPIFGAPFQFPEGAHPLWAHAGRESLAIKHNGRIVCYYHPGDINDAWKTGHSGASEAVAEQAYKLGVNVVYYSFVKYYSQHHPD